MIIKRQTLGFISHQIAHFGGRGSLSNLRGMALVVKDPFVAGFHGSTRVGVSNDMRLRFPQKALALVNGRSLLRINASNELNCSDHVDDIHRRGERFHKPRAVAEYQKLIRDSEVRLEEEPRGKLINGHGAIKRGNPLGFPSHPMNEKMVVAVDVDEVLGSFVAALNQFIADRYNSTHSLSEYHVYEFYKIWKCSRDEADIRVHEFFKTSYFKNGVLPIPGALSALHKLSEFCNLSIVTSRQNIIKDHTIEWIEEHYPGLFQEIHFGNHFALDGVSRPKSDICRSLGARVLIDDNPRYAIECADAGIKVLLFDYENSYPWSKMHSATEHPLVTKVHNWEEVEKKLLSWVMS